jgi:hypothetical protein
MEASRRKINTYGKTTKKILVHDLFNVSSNPSKASESLYPTPVEDVTRTRTVTPSSEFSEDPETSHQLKAELRASFSKPQERSVHSSRSQTPASAASPQVFELNSSEDEIKATKPAPKTYKRRKLGDVSVADAHSDPEQQQTQTSNYVSKQKAGAVLKRNKKVENKTIQLSDEDAKPSESDAPRPAHSTHSLQSPPSSNKSPASPRAISPASMKSTDSMVSTRSTPKRKRNDADAVTSDQSSPSQLGMASLRLTPGRRDRSRPKSTDFEMSDSSGPSPPRSRARLVDRLDSPKKAADVVMKDTSPRPAKLRKTAPAPTSKAAVTQEDIPESSASQPQLPRESSLTSTNGGPRVRTYGKQRSHLKDMVPGLDSQTQSSSQSSLQDLLSQVNSLKTSSQTKDQFAMESDDEDPGTRLKSIHELRQTGLADRFGREVEAIFEDIESDAKSLRIQGLMKLVEKLQPQAVRATFLSSEKLQRLTDVATANLDLTSASMLLLALMALTNSETATAQNIAQIYKSLLDLSPRVLEERRSVSRVARDRKENLAKALIKDIIEFESRVVEKSHGAGQQAVKSIIVSRVALKTLESLLQTLQAFAERAPAPSKQWIVTALRELNIHTEALQRSADHPEHLESIRLLVSWLDMTSKATRESMYKLTSTQLNDFAAALASVIDVTRAEFPSIAQVCIKMILELSNGEPSVSDEFAQVTLVQSLFATIQDGYDYFASANDGEAVDESKHQPTILALGCLSHLVEHSFTARELMLSSSAVRSQIVSCVEFFKQHVDDAEEVRVSSTQTDPES